LGESAFRLLGLQLRAGGLRTCVVQLTLSSAGTRHSTLALLFQRNFLARPPIDSTRE
jgi:hypothetical protein